MLGLRSTDFIIIQEDNNVKIITDCSKYIEYVKTKYGVNYINSFKLG